MTTNEFCDLKTLQNESDVEQFFVIRLLKALGYDDADIRTKTSLSELVISKGSKKELYKPDYVCFYDKKPKIVIDAKNPDENLDNFTYQVGGYAYSLNSKFKGEKPVRFTILTNGIYFKLYKWDEEEPLLSMKFDDFKKGNQKYEHLFGLISVDSIKEQTGKNEIEVQIFYQSHLLKK